LQHAVCQTSFPFLPKLWVYNVLLALQSPVLVSVIPPPSRDSHLPLTGNKNSKIRLMDKLQRTMNLNITDKQSSLNHFYRTSPASFTVFLMLLSQIIIAALAFTSAKGPSLVSNLYKVSYLFKIKIT